MTAFRFIETEEIGLVDDQFASDNCPYRKMTGTELKIVLPAQTEVLGPEVDRLPTLHTNAKTDDELLAVWLKSHADSEAKR